MNPIELEKQLSAEGFTHTYVWEDGPGAFYPDHTHPTETAHVILEGEMTVTTQGTAQTYKPASASMFRPTLCTPRRWDPRGAAT